MPLQIIRQDITKMKVDAIVNTTNENMIGYSGVDLAVHIAAGDGLDKECAQISPLDLGCAKITGAYNLPSKYVIHTLGPVWRGGFDGEKAVLRSCYLESLKLAIQYNCNTVAFPLISSGSYHFPKDMVLKFAIQVITEFLLDNELTVYICVFDKASYTFSQKLFNDIKTFIDDDYMQDYDEDYYDILEPKACIESNFDGRAEILPSQLKESLPQEESYASIELNTNVSLADYLKNLDKSFQQMLFDFIDERKMSDVECYKKANVDKRTFSKIKSNPKYRPSKQTAIAFAIALELDLEQTQKLLSTLGYTLSHSSVFDKIIRYFIQNKNYNIFEINEALFEFDQILLGSV